MPFVTYMLGILTSCYRTLDERYAALASGGSNEEILRTYFDRLLGKVTKRQIMDDNPVMSQRTVERLLQVVGSQHAEDDGYVLGGVEVSAALCGAVTDVVEVRRAATNDAADHDDGVIASGACHLGCTEGQFDSTGHVGHGNVFIALTGKQVKGTLQEGTCYLVIPLGADDAHGEAVHMGYSMEGASFLALIQFS
jgi:hypothetical protein